MERQRAKVMILKFIFRFQIPYDDHFIPNTNEFVRLIYDWFESFQFVETDVFTQVN